MPKPHHADGFYIYDDGTVRNLDRNRILGKAVELPTADVVEVVRCKECKNNQNPRTSGNADCELFYGMTDQEGFCSYGDRREDGI